MGALRFRIWLGGDLHLEEWIDEHADPVAAADAARRHATITMTATVPWLVEVYDPTADPTNAYIRFGTDDKGMVEPRPIDNIAQALGLDPP